MSRLPRFLATFVGEWRGMYRDATDLHARDALHERRWNGLRRRRVRLALVALGALAILAVAPAFLLTPTLGIVATLLVIGVWFALRRSLRELGDLPERTLDERQVALRNRAYRIAWKIFMGVFTTALAFVVGLTFGAAEGAGFAATIQPTLSAAGIVGVAVALAGVTAILPYAVLAWMEPEEEPHEQALRIVRSTD